MSDLVQSRFENGAFTIMLNRPDRRNALGSEVLAELHEAVDQIGGDPAVRVVVITGAGVDFSAGADMKATPDERAGVEGTPTGAHRLPRSS